MENCIIIVVNILFNLQKQPFTDDELIKIKKYLKPWMLDVVKELGVTNETHLEKDIDDLIKFEEKLVEVTLKAKFN